MGVLTQSAKPRYRGKMDGFLETTDPFRRNEEGGTKCEKKENECMNDSCSRPCATACNPPVWVNEVVFMYGSSLAGGDMDFKWLMREVDAPRRIKVTTRVLAMLWWPRLKKGGLRRSRQRRCSCTDGSPAATPASILAVR